MSGLELKETNFKLPSLGKPYDASLGLINGDSVMLRPWVAGDQRHFAVSGLDNHTAYTTFLVNKVAAPSPIDCDKLLMDDVNALVYAVRVMSHGTKYNMPIVCVACRELVVQEVDLNTINVKSAEETDEGFQTKDLEIELGGKQCIVHMKTMKDEKQIAANMGLLRRTKRLLNEGVDLQFVTFAQAIDTIDGEAKPFNTKFDFVINLSQQDFDKLGQFINGHTFGIDDKVEAVCVRCGTEQTARLVITPEFFRPTTNPS